MTKLKIARDVAVYVPDLGKYGVPGSDLPIWRYRREVDPNWMPGSDYPAVVAKPLPSRHGNMAVEAIQERMRFLFPEAKYPILQVISETDSLDLRSYQTTTWVNPVFHGQTIVSDGYNKELPIDQHKPLGSASSMFLNTVHYCFSNHYPLGIRPDALMWMVLHEIGICVRQNPQFYRHLFTDSAKKELIDVQVNEINLDLFNQTEEWAYGIELLQSGLRSKMPSDLLKYLLPQISTHDLGSQTASYVAVLDAATPFYDMLMRVCCGIPNIRLFGKAEDYDNIVEACTVLAELFSEHLGNYFLYLLPVLQEIADTVAGRKKIDNKFWASIYNHYSGSGVDDMDGWITAFVNYEFKSGTPVVKDARLFDWRANLKLEYGQGIHREDIPSHLSSVPFVLNYAKNHHPISGSEFAGRNLKAENGGNGINFDCRLVGGFISVQDIDGFATPTLGYAVIRGDVLDTKVNGDKWTVHPENRTPITAPKRSVFGASNPSGRID